MNLIIFILISLLCVNMLIFFEKKVGNNAIFLFGIGSIINGSIFHIFSYPIVSLNIHFGLDFLLAPIFFMCLYLMHKKEKSKSAKTMLLVSVLSLLFSASIQFLSSNLSNGYLQVYLHDFVGFVFNIASYFISGLVLIFALDKINLKRPLNLTLTLFLVNCLNFILFYFSRFFAFNFINWNAFLSFFAFNIFLNLTFVTIQKLYNKEKNEKI